MPLKLLPATESSAARIAQIERAAYADKPMNDVLFPGPFPPSVLDGMLDGRAANLAKELREDPTCHWLKVIDPDIIPSFATESADGYHDEQIIGFAQWNIRANGEPLPPGRAFSGPGVNDEACEALFGGIHRMRERVVGDRKHVHLRLCFVDPKGQRRGAGKLLVMWGVEEAARLGLPAFLEASEEGYHLYRSCGFRDVEKLVVDCKKWGVDDAVTVAMVKEP
ncbi:acetyltransferase [Xylariaceae sp. FL0255]|nr:acetyltransferase [Xylariaceae sp. FL0255]